MAEPILSISHLTKFFRSYWAYRKLPAVNDVSLEVEEGEAFGFLGHNGAGKTTTMKCVIGLLKPNAGTILYHGKRLDDFRLRSEIGYLPELPYFYEHLSVWETVDLFAQLFGMSGKERSVRTEEALSKVRLLDRRKQRVRELSKGLQQRLGLANVLLNRPKLVLLDEPFSGLDPLGRREFRELFFELKAAGTTIFLSTHVLSDIEDICDRVSIMARGKLAATFSLAEIPRMFGSSYEITIGMPSVNAPLLEILNKSLPGIGVRQTAHGNFASGSCSDYATAERVLSWAAENKLPVESFQRRMPSLEDIFVQITEREAAAARS